jgi:DNA-binding transcriptional regulator YhcF (GntR family)
MHLSIDPQERSPLHRQLADQIRYAISVGELVPGDPLPSIRDLEAQLQINRNTVRRAYLDLEAEGLLVLRQGREAQVAPQSRQRIHVDVAGRVQLAKGFVRTMMHRAESDGLDALDLAESFAGAAREHDASYPKWVFLECSVRQAQQLADCVERRISRRVVGLDLHDLRDQPQLLPTSVRYAITPPWHAGEARDLLQSHGVDLFIVGVRLGAACRQSLRTLRGQSIGLVVRDAQSAPGFGAMVRKHTGAKDVRVAVSGDADDLHGLLRRVDAVVHTPPCDEAVRAAAPPSMTVHELVFEPNPADVQTAYDEALAIKAPTVRQRKSRADVDRLVRTNC